MGAKVPLMVAQANEANTATAETPAKARPCVPSGWRFVPAYSKRPSVSEILRGLRQA